MRHLRQSDGWYVVHDGCIEVRWRNYNTREVVAQRKRRPRGATPEVCTWHPTVPCADHPQKPPTYHPGSKRVAPPGGG